MYRTVETDKKIQLRCSFILIVVFIAIMVLVITVPLVVINWGHDSIPPVKVTGLSQMLHYFAVNDGSSITWGHAINSPLKLLKSLKDKTMMIEADVIYDTIAKLPIMAHSTVDLTLSLFLTSLLGTPKKGIKLDVKEIKALGPAVTVLNKELIKTKTSADKIPIIINANVLIGPNNSTEVPLDDAKYFSLCSSVTGAILSPGWTSEWSNTEPNNTGYTWSMVKDMHLLTKDIHNSVTFPIRASLASISKEQLQWLLEQNLIRYSFTVWSSLSDKFDCNAIKYLFKYPKNVMYDIPKSQCTFIERGR